MTDDTLTTEEVAHLLRVTPDTVYRYLKRGELRGYRLGKKSGWRIRKDDVDRFIAVHFNQQVTDDEWFNHKPNGPD